MSTIFCINWESINSAKNRHTHLVKCHNNSCTYLHCTLHFLYIWKLFLVFLQFLILIIFFCWIVKHQLYTQVTWATSGVSVEADNSRQTQTMYRPLLISIHLSSDQLWLFGLFIICLTENIISVSSYMN